jgi:hypothetical protein
MAINWALLGEPVDVQGAVNRGFQTGRALRRQSIEDSAAATLAMNPSDPDALSRLASVDPEKAWAYQDHADKVKARAFREAVLGAGPPSAFGAPVAPAPGAFGMSAPAVEPPMTAAPTPPPAASAVPSLNTGALAQYFALDPDGAKDVASFVQGLDKTQRETMAAKYKAAGPVLVRAQQLPYAQRRGLIEAAKPALLGQGWTEQEIGAFDPTDQNLNGLATAAMTVEQVVDANKITWHQRGEAPSFATDSMGHLIDPQAVLDGTVSGSPAAPSSVAPPAPAAAAGPATAFHFSRVPGDSETSGFRTREHNRAVGGVANSFHTVRDAAGNPMASDRVPPRGMSMVDFHAELTRLNPHLDVINEGDHVHLEPKGHPTRTASIETTAQRNGRTYYKIHGQWYDNPEGR